MGQYSKLDIALLLLRLVFGFRLVYGTVDNVFSWSRMMEFTEFLESNNFPVPLISAIISVYVQFLAGLSWILGYQTKIFSMLMIFNFLVALFGVHLASGHSYLQMAPAVHMLCIAVFVYLLGPGKLSIQERF